MLSPRDLCRPCVTRPVLAQVDVKEAGVVEDDVSMQPYHDTLEGVLAWLLDAEENLQRQGDVGRDVHAVKEQFHAHEVGGASRTADPQTFIAYWASVFSQPQRCTLRDLSRQGVLLPVADMRRNAANAPQVNILLRFSKLLCAARSARVP